jgi:hypothetical protein
MNTNKHLSILLLTTIFAGTATASNFEWSKLKPYVGADAQERKMDFKGGFGDNIFQHTAPQGNIYAGLKFKDFVALELGYEATTTRTREATLTTGDVAAGTPVPSVSSPVVFKSKAKIKGPHVDLVGFYPFYADSPFQLLGSVGVAVLKGTFERRTIQMAGAASGTRRTLSHNKSVIRLAGGLQYMLGQHFGTRMTVGWVNTSKMVIQSDDAIAPIAIVKPKNSTTYGLGILWAF